MERKSKTLVNMIRKYAGDEAALDFMAESVATEEPEEKKPLVEVDQFLAMKIYNLAKEGLKFDELLDRARQKGQYTFRIVKDDSRDPMKGFVWFGEDEDGSPKIVATNYDSSD